MTAVIVCVFLLLIEHYSLVIFIGTSRPRQGDGPIPGILWSCEDLRQELSQYGILDIGISGPLNRTFDVHTCHAPCTGPIRRRHAGRARSVRVVAAWMRNDHHGVAGGGHVYCHG
jgi:hypothetical protein